MKKAATKTESKRARYEKLLLAPSCAGCKWHDMNMAGPEHQKPEGPTLFNHWCENPAYAEFYGIVPIHELTARIAPAPPAWCREKRPSFYF